jgi:hypothetical protein
MATGCDDSIVLGFAAMGANSDRAISIGRGSIVNGGQFSIAIGDGATTSTHTNGISLGAGAACIASNQVTLGNVNITALRCQVTSITAISDMRDKKEIETLEPSLEFIEKLKPVRFKWNMRDGGKVDVPEIGFLAQDLQEVQQDTGVSVPNLVYDVNPERLEASYGTLLPLMVKSIQELSQEIKQLKERIHILETR